MFRITEGTSSGSLAQCMVKNYTNDSIVSVDMEKVSVMAACPMYYEGSMWVLLEDYESTMKVL